MVHLNSADLDALHTHLTLLATEAGLMVLPGTLTIDEGHYPLWRWSGDQGTEGEFVTLAQRAGTRLVYADRSVLDLDSLIRFELQEAYLIGEEEDEDGGEDKEPHTFRQLKSSLRRWWKKDGQPYAIAFIFFHQGVGHILFVISAWFEELGTDITQHIGELKEQNAQTFRDSASKERVLRRSQAETMARDDRYGRARNDRQRQIVAEEMFPELDYVEIRDLLAVSKAIFQDEVAPGLEKELAGQARKLYDAGDTVGRISVKMGISKDRVERLLYLANV